MRQSVQQLRAFYASPLGCAARDMIGRKVVEAWGQAGNLDMLGVGYATPYLDPFRGSARRTLAAMFEAQGAERWPAGSRGLACLTPEGRLPFPASVFDRILLIHALEGSVHPAALLAEVNRVLAPQGRVIVIAASRSGFWSHADHTPFGHGRPYSRTQLEGDVRAAGLEPAAWSRALYAPPLSFLASWAEAIEQAGAAIASPLSGVLMMEAVKEVPAVRPRGLASPVLVPSILRPRPVRAAVKSPNSLGGEGNIGHRSCSA